MVLKKLSFNNTSQSNKPQIYNVVFYLRRVVLRRESVSRRNNGRRWKKTWREIEGLQGWREEKVKRDNVGARKNVNVVTGSYR